MDLMHDKLSFIQKSLDMGEYDVVVKECSTLFEVSLRRVFNEALVNLPFKDRIELQECEKKIGKGNKGVQDFGFGELVGLFRESKLMNRWSKHSSRDLGLINSLDLAPIVNLRNQVTHEGFQCTRYEAELIYNYLRNLLATIGLSDLNTGVRQSFSDKGHKDVKNTTENHDNERIFKYLPERGLIVNPSDNSRNISIKVETINKIFDIIYRETAAISNSETALGIFRKAGYESGKKFGEIMNNKWELEQNDLTFNSKISKWCEFDSDVGWGKLINEINVNEDEGSISGSLVISENFQADKRKKDDPLICDYIKGYAEGVLEELLTGLQIKLECEMDKCPINNPFKKKCYCNVKLKGE